MQVNAVEYLLHAAAAFPEKTALSDKNETITYRELLDRVRRTAGFVSSRLGGRHRQPVFVAITRSIQSIVLFLGVAYSGNFYVPVDLSLPEARLKSMQDVIAPTLCLRTDKCGKSPFEEALPTAEYAEITAYDGAQVTDTLPNDCLDTDPIYCIFTSGSTGIPKAVCVSHRSVIDMVESFSEVFPLDDTSVFGNQAPFDFDVSVKDIYLSLRHGGTLHVLEKMLFSFPGKLIERLNEQKINTVIWAVSAMKIVTALGTFKDILPAHLRLVMFSGEVMPPDVLAQWRKAADKATFVNLYGPTEITCNCTYYIVPDDFADGREVPAGRAFKNTGLLLLQDGRLITQPGQLGEICITGTCLALGYYNDAERTAAAFCQNPLHKNFPERIYRTGDLGEYDAAGELLFRGRADTQIKHMGHRIELVEVEAASAATGLAAYTCCLFDEKNDTICLFYQSESDLSAAFAMQLRRQLPGFMVPTRFERLDLMPQTRTGKIDRTSLRNTYFSG